MISTRARLGAALLLVVIDSTDVDGSAIPPPAPETAPPSPVPTEDRTPPDVPRPQPLGPTCPADCDDGDACTADACGPDGACVHEPRLAADCRPVIDVTFPARAQAVLARPDGSRTVTVTGRVESGAGPITSLTINGAEVTVGADGAFAHDVEAVTGGNALVFEAIDARGHARRRVQSYAWSSVFDLPLMPPAGVAPAGLALFLAPESLDDGTAGPPVRDLADVLELVLDHFDAASLVDAETAVAHRAGYDVYVTDLSAGDGELGLHVVDGGIAMTASLADIGGDLQFDCTSATCALAGGDDSGGLSIARVALRAELELSVEPDHTLKAELDSVTVSVDPRDVRVWSDNAWTDTLLSVVERFVLDGLSADLEDRLERAVAGELGPALAGGFSRLSLATRFRLPDLGRRGSPVEIDLFAEFADIELQDGRPARLGPTGASVTLHAGGYPRAPTSIPTGLGVPRRDGCGAGALAPRLPRRDPLELGVSDDLLNQLLYAAWRGGWLDLTIDGDDLGAAGASLAPGSAVTVRGLAPPLASDCGPDGALRIMLGDLRLEASLIVLGQPVTFVAFVTLVVRVAIGETRDGVALDIDEVESVEIELTAGDDAIGLEPMLVATLDDALVGAVLERLGGFGAITLPRVDLGGLVGLVPGTAELAIEVRGTSRAPGMTIVSAALR